MFLLIVGYISKHFSSLVTLRLQFRFMSFLKFESFVLIWNDNINVFSSCVVESVNLGKDL